MLEFENQEELSRFEKEEEPLAEAGSDRLRDAETDADRVQILLLQPSFEILW